VEFPTARGWSGGLLFAGSDCRKLAEMFRHVPSLEYRRCRCKYRGRVGKNRGPWFLVFDGGIGVFMGGPAQRVEIGG
jgi:hypothetical protein